MCHTGFNFLEKKDVDVNQDSKYDELRYTQSGIMVKVDNIMEIISSDQFKQAIRNRVKDEE